jgi:hypothetical protein
MTDEKRDFVLKFTKKNEINGLTRRRLTVQAKNRGEAIEIGRRVAADSKGKWNFEGVEI